jgi:PadR family transcriptional regulator PadR
MLADPTARFWGYPLSRAAGIRSGVMYPLLTRWLEAGWLTDGWEDHASTERQGRPPRRYYELTDAGRAELTQLVDREGQS